MSDDAMKPAPLAFKPDLEKAAARWNAFHAGELVDRPILSVTARRDDTTRHRPRSYRDNVFCDLDEVIGGALESAEATWWGGEAMPCFNPSFGPDEVAAFVGAEFAWSDESPNTNWSVPFVEDWESCLPLKIGGDNPLWQRILELYRRASEQMAGKMLLTPLDLHTNMDLLAAIRGPERLCMDLIDQPEMIDEAMRSSRALFRPLWDAVVEAGRMKEYGFYQHVYSMEGAAMLQCDFIAMIGPPMFRRWVLPALEEEAAIVERVFFHWDGPDALRHTDDILASKGLYLLAYVPGTGRGAHIDYLDRFKAWQEAGKAIFAHGTPDQLKAMHRELDPAKSYYQTSVKTPAEGEALLKWFVDNT